MKHIYFPKSRGFSLIEVAVVLIIIAIIAAILTPLVSQLIYVQKSTAAYDELGRVYTAIVGNPSQGTFGYLGDVGDYPTSLMDLVQLPASNPAGWNGPYLTDARVDTGVIYDAFGSPMEYFYSPTTTNQLAIISPGPDRSSTNSGGNVYTSFTGTLPSNASYGVTTFNFDNVVYPRFTDNLGLLNYQHIGTVNLNVLNYDYNPSVSAYVPACPNFWEFKATSVPRPLDTFGTATSGTSPAYTPGGASFELIQGVYKFQLRTQTVPNTSYYDSTIAVLPGSNQTLDLRVPGPDSSVTPTYSLSVTNNLATVAGITVYSFATSLGASVANGGGTATYSGVHGCSQITVRNSTTNAVVDSFVFPIGIGTYTKIYNTSTFNFILTNGGTYPYLWVYQNNLLIGEVSKFGNKRQKTFSGIKQNDIIVVKDDAGTTRLTINPFPGSNQSNTV